MTNLSLAIVKNEILWAPVGYVKVKFSLFLERRSHKYESFECFQPCVLLKVALTPST